VLLSLSWGCSHTGDPITPRRYLAITHSALNRLSFFDLDRKEVVGVLPTQKLPHDMLLSPDGNTLLVINSGAQCLSAYALDSPGLWQQAAAFMASDSSRNPSSGAPLQMGSPHRNTASSPEKVSLNKDAVQTLPESIVRHYRTDGTYPPQASEQHRRVNAESRIACFDCHDRSVGGKPFGPMFSADSSQIYLVHLAYKNLTVLDSRTLAILRQIPLALSENLSPIEVWVHPAKPIAFVTCRNEIGASLPGVILVVDLATGTTAKRIPAGIYPWHLVPDPAGKRLYVNNFQSSTISVIDIDRQEIIDTLVAQNGPAMMSFVPGSDKLLVSCFYTDNVVVLNTTTGVTERVIRVDTNPTSLAFADGGATLYVLCGGESSLNVVDLESGNVTERHQLLFGAYAFHEIRR